MSTVAQRAEAPLGTPPLAEGLVQVLSALLPMQLPAKASWEVVGGGSSAWAPATHVEDPDGILGCRL